ncbi:protein FAR1-RELATED SEQUENCE 5-like [Ipomoea triloba]|uniref:protein FAR1-RELATED SEQUENCE 5-like n=1 Tax=Ipomoea triloba TaxID=35885 RepID=UPI00125E7445|nr:protein FAR1-RELATED SEQUENCE 5-like [Ipomoea triloba]
MLLPSDGDHISTIVKSTFPMFATGNSNPNLLEGRAILAPTLDVVNSVNEYMNALHTSESRTYFSCDTVCKADADNGILADVHTPEFLNGIRVSGLPNHSLTLKIGSPVMLMRNIDHSIGLCNGTRLIITKLADRIIEAEIMTGANKGNKVLIPRMSMSPSDPRLPFKFQRKQFPLMLSYAMTINKSQGQTLSHVGLLLKKSVFVHGVNMDSASGGCDESYSTDTGVEVSACDMEISPGMTKQSTTRKGRDGGIVLKHVVCSREGFKHRHRSDAKRRRVSSRVGCKAKVVFKFIPKGCYSVHFFEERHTHSMCSSIAKQFLKVNRNLDVSHQIFVASCVRANIGPTRSYRLFKEIVGDYSNVGATSVDFQNFKRDLMAYILNGDAQLFIDTLFKRRELCEAFGFEYDVDEADQLSRVFLADAVSRKNFSLFGDVVSFDATYRTNRYNLVFVPFTGIDNHKRCITFGAGLLTKEDIDSYVWLLESFKKIMGHDPICVVTDQDPAVKVAVAQVFGASKHRFCMWHIMCKVGEKVGPILSKDEVFRRKLNCIVWDNSIDPEAFELRWNQIMEEYGLGDNGWFRYLFESRTFWASPYFHDEFMAGLVRTTSRSKSQNSFFGSFSNGHSSLVEFLVHYDSAIGAQRHAQAKLNDDCEACFPVLKTPLALERHAMGVYTISVFYDVQEEICAACFSCQVVSLSDSDGSVSYMIKDGNHRAWVVNLVLDDNCARCSCKMFERVGLLCKHIFFVFKDRGLESIPSRYLVHRWTKGACLHPIFDIDGIVVDQSAKVENVRLLTNLMWSDIYACVGLADGNIDRLSQIRSVINDQRKLFLQDGSDNGSSVAGGSKQSVINSFCGSMSKASSVEVHDPVKAKNKGSGKRLKSARERAASKCAKQSRRCHTCDEYGHNSRTCPLNN